MPFNGNGVAGLIYNWDQDAANGILVESSRMDTQEQDIADMLTDCMTRDGQSPATNDIPLGGFKITGLANGVSAQDAITVSQALTGATYINPTFTGNANGAGATTFTVPTVSVSDASTNAASTAFVAAVSFSTNLPGQGGHSGQFITTDGANASWAYAATLTRSARTANTILGQTDRNTLIDITSGTFSQTFTAAATLGSGWNCFIKNSGTGDITLDPNGAELIDGLASYIMYPDEVRLVQCDGSAFHTIVVNSFTRTWTANGTFTKAPGYRSFFCETVGGGAGGGGGQGAAAGNVRNGGSGGGGGVYVPNMLAASLFGATETVTVGAASAGGAGGVNAAGSNGVLGNSSSIGSLTLAYGGGNGLGGQSGGGNICGGSGAGSYSQGISGQTGTSVVGGSPCYPVAVGITLATGSQGGYGLVNAAGGPAESGGGGGGGLTGDGTASFNGGPSVLGGAGGGAGGSVSAGNAGAAFGTGGLRGSYSYPSAGGGAANGGASRLAGTGFDGTAGASAGDGGGGGGGGTNTGGNGGVGHAGQVTISGIF